MSRASQRPEPTWEALKSVLWVMVPIILIIAAIALTAPAIPVKELKRRCVQAYQQSRYPQVRPVEYILSVHSKFPKPTEGNEGRLIVRNPETGEQLTLHCQNRRNKTASLHAYE